LHPVRHRHGRSAGPNPAPHGGCHGVAGGFGGPEGAEDGGPEGAEGGPEGAEGDQGFHEVEPHGTADRLLQGKQGRFQG